ncbi:MAG: FapA family protein [Deltaproteobacteria bacterium]|nr:FapA family protein [Deltaproteobacteria bacterium]MCX7952743.1 FapA family protein [Deltaproteobacteria bacterium]
MQGNLTEVRQLSLLDTRFTFYVDESKTKLFCTASGSTPFIVLKDKLIEFLQNNFPGAIIDELLLRECVVSRSEKPRRVGVSKVPTKPQDEKLILLAKPFSLEQKSGLRFLDNIEPEREVARLIPAKEGEDGFDVFGQIIKADPPKKIAIQTGPNIEVRQEQNYASYYSKKFGYLFFDQKLIDIREELLIEGGVTQAIGNIRFNNVVRIKGDVGVGFIVKGDRGVFIEGDIYRDSEIFSSQGSVIVKGSCSLAKLAAFEKIQIKKVHRSTLKASEIVVEEESLSSELNAISTVTCKRVIGGYVCAAKQIEIGEVGAEGGAETVLEIVSDYEHKKKISETLKKISLLSRSAKLIKMQLGPYEFRNPKDLPEALQAKINTLKQKLSQVEDALGILKHDLNQLISEQKEIFGQITIKRKIGQNTVFRFGDQELKFFEEKIGPVVAKLSDGKIIS